MEKIIEGISYTFGKNIDTDQICPGQYLELTEHKDIAAHCLEGADENFSTEFVEGGIVVALENFGCGSSREHAVIALNTIGVSAVVAKSFARIFYRNGINIGIPLIVCKDIEMVLNDRDELKIDLEKNTITNLKTNVEVSCEAISDYAMDILNHGGIKKMLRK